MHNLKEWIEEVLNDNGCHLYELEWITNQGTPVLRVSVEKEDGTMDLDTCATCSDAIGTMLDEKDLRYEMVSEFTYQLLMSKKSY